jgi:hypothetical protein
MFKRVYVRARLIEALGHQKRRRSIMSVVLCPGCKEKGFHWSIDDDNRTNWYCALCGFSAQEDESGEKPCAACGTGTAILLTDDTQTYYWCIHCGAQLAARSNSSTNPAITQS